MLIALKADDRVYLAYNLCDMPVKYFDRQDFTLPDNVPVWKVKNGCIMGCEAAPDEADLFRYDGRLFRGDIDMYNLLEKIAPSMRKKLEAFRKIEEDGETGAYFIAQGGNCYCIFGKGSCEELDDYFTEGEGNDVAASSLDMTAGLPAEERIKKAYEAVEAATFIPAYPIAVADTKTCEVKIIEKA